MVHYVIMSTEHDFSPESKQYKWMQHDLSNVNRKKTPWVIFAGHRAMYTSLPAPGMLTNPKYSETYLQRLKPTDTSVITTDKKL